MMIMRMTLIMMIMRRIIIMMIMRMTLIMIHPGAYDDSEKGACS